MVRRYAHLSVEHLAEHAERVAGLCVVEAAPDVTHGTVSEREIC